MDRSEEVGNNVEVRVGIEGENEKKKSSRDFRNGVITGGLIAALLFVGIYAGRMAYQMYRVREARANAASEGSESVINAETLQKMKVIEDAIQNRF
ncbi:MAG: hypothetical protein K2M81_03020 [Lachnospiraceae bacterium]|nr:hypothetical protein [Lachnospiraceae bacterium]